MKCTIAKRFHFEAAHWLPCVPADHRCSRMHGHNYVVWIEFTGEIGEDGFCAGLDYIELYRIVQPVLAVLDHRIVNETIPNSTAENIAAWFVSRVHIPQLSAVTVYETDDTWARVEK